MRASPGALALALLTAMTAQGQDASRPTPERARPRIFAVSPLDGATRVSPNAFVATDLLLPNSGQGVSRQSLGPETVHLQRVSDGQPVPATVNTSGGRDVIVLKPTEPLAPNERYVFTVTDRVVDKSGAAFIPFESRFTTGPLPPPISLPFAFEKVSLPTTLGRAYTSVATGPDHRLYAATLTGEIVRFALGPDGVTGPGQVITSLIEACGKPRAIIGLTFDPRATARNLVLWVSHGPEDLKTAPDWEDRITRLTGPDLQTVQDYVIGLPQSIGHHRTNGIAFRPSEPEVLYFAQASTSAMGAADPAWGFRPEHLLSAAILRLDLRHLKKLPLDARTEGHDPYDPHAPGAPLTVFATGVRNAYDLVWHSNGNLYAASNGSAAWGSTPASPQPLPESCSRRTDAAERGPYRGPAVPGIEAVFKADDDYLFRIVRGGYYGHPNPTRCEWVMNGGNPTGGPDPGEQDQYPVGTAPDRNWRGASFDFGRHYSADGIIEYRSKVFGSALRGKLLVARYSGGDDVAVLALGKNGEVARIEENALGMTGFSDPLDLVEDASSGALYVAEQGAERITMLVPRPAHAAAARAPGWISLFDGRTLNGWIRRGGSGLFAAENGTIVGTSVPNTPTTFLCTERSYGDFLLEYEFRVDDRFNSGVQIRGQLRPDSGRVFGYQVEIDPDTRQWTGGLFDEGRRGWLASLEHNEAARRAFMPGKWNHIRAEVRGDRFRTWVNGVPAADLLDSVDLDGFVGLQLHHVGAKQDHPLRVAWRDLRMKDLGRHEWRSLIRGPALSGFRARRGRWTVDDGTLVGEGEGLLVSEALLGDATVRLEYRLHGPAAALSLRGVGREAGAPPGRGLSVELPPSDAWREVTVSIHGARMAIHRDGKLERDREETSMTPRGRLTLAVPGAGRLELRRLERLVPVTAAEPRTLAAKP